MRNGLPSLVFQTVGYFTTKQLRAIHRNLGHPSVECTMKLIEKADLQDKTEDTRKQIFKIAPHCRACQFNKRKPRRFLFSVKDGITGEFNRSYGNVVHIICSGTGFQQGKFLKDMIAASTWNIYAGAPDYIHTNAGSNFYSKEFIEAADKLGIVVKVMPTEAYERIGK